MQAKKGATCDANPYAAPPPFTSASDGTFRQRLAQAWETGWLRCIGLARDLTRTFEAQENDSQGDGNVFCSGWAKQGIKRDPSPMEVEYGFQLVLRQHGSGEQAVSTDKMTFQEAMAIDRFAVLIPRVRSEALSRRCPRHAA